MSEHNTTQSSANGRRFHLLERLGAGAYGAVYLAEQESAGGFKRRVALKVLHPHHHASTEAGKRMRDEARILGRLQHRHIVTVLDLVELQDRWAVVMEVVPGADLEAVLQALEQVSESFPVQAALEVGVYVCRALDFAWDCDDGNGKPLHVVHRDIKPSNIRLSPEGDIKVLDFGISSVQMETRESETGRFRVGTERYMAPERILGDPDTPAGDVYATALVVQELLLGEPMGRTPIIPARHDKLVEETLAKLEEKHGELSFWAELRALLKRGLAALPEDRPSVAEFGEALDALRKGSPGDDLRSFGGRFVPAVTRLLGKEVESATGTLAERTVSSGTAVPYQGSAPTLGELPAPTGMEPFNADTVPPLDDRGSAPSAPTLSPPDVEETWQERASTSTSSGEFPISEQQEKPARDNRWALALLLLLPLIAAGAWGLTRPEPEPPPPVREAPVRSSVVAEPGVPELPKAEPEAPEPEANTTPEPTEPEVAPAPEPPTPAKVTRPTAPAVRKAPEPTGPPVSAAMFALPDASSLRVDCGGTTGTGTASVRLRDFPSGTCTVGATWLGTSYETRVTVEKRGEVRCTVASDSLNCEVR